MVEIPISPWQRRRRVCADPGLDQVATSAYGPSVTLTESPLWSPRGIRGLLLSLRRIRGRRRDTDARTA